MKRYVYAGPVYEFDNLVASKWKGETIARSRAQARNNLAYQFKRQTNRTANTRIRVTGDLLEFDI